MKTIQLPVILHRWFPDSGEGWAYDQSLQQDFLDIVSCIEPATRERSRDTIHFETQLPNQRRLVGVMSPDDECRFPLAQGRNPFYLVAATMPLGFELSDGDRRAIISGLLNLSLPRKHGRYRVLAVTIPCPQFESPVPAATLPADRPSLNPNEWNEWVDKDLGHAPLILRERELDRRTVATESLKTSDRKSASRVEALFCIAVFLTFVLHALNYLMYGQYSVSSFHGILARSAIGFHLVVLMLVGWYEFQKVDIFSRVASWRFSRRPELRKRRKPSRD